MPWCFLNSRMNLVAVILQASARDPTLKVVPDSDCKSSSAGASSAGMVLPFAREQAGRLHSESNLGNSAAKRVLVSSEKRSNWPTAAVTSPTSMDRDRNSSDRTGSLRHQCRAMTSCSQSARTKSIRYVQAWAGAGLHEWIMRGSIITTVPIPILAIPAGCRNVDEPASTIPREYSSCVCWR